MKSDIIFVTSRGRSMEAALEQADKVAAYKGLSDKNCLHLRLLIEEMMGMMRSITGETEGQFWIEDQDGVYQLHLKTETRLNENRRNELIAVSTSGKNESAKGLMGKIRDFFSYYSDDEISAMASPLMLTEMYDHSSTPMLDWEWSMTEYEDALSARVRKNAEGAREAWDELEKSVVAHVADEIKVSVHGRAAELIIFKKLS